MNVCLCIISSRWGGLEAVVYDLAQHLRQCGDGVVVAANEEVMPDYADLENEGVKLHNFGPFPLFSGRHPGNSKFISNLRLVTRFYLFELNRSRYYQGISAPFLDLLEENNIEVIQAHNAESIKFISHIRPDIKVPVVATSGGVHALRDQYAAHPLMRPLRRWKSHKLRQSMNQVNWIREGSNYMRTAWEEFGVVVDGRFSAIPPGLDLKLLQSKSDQKVPMNGSFNLLFPGGARMHKGGDLVLEALARTRIQIPDIHLYIALDVPEGHFLRAMVDDLGLADIVTFTGLLPREQYWGLLQSVDVLVLPSRMEIFPIACVEALACGKPVIATRVGGIPDVVEHGRNGMLIDYDVEAVVNGILDLYHDRELRERISAKNLDDALRFEWNQIAEQFKTLYTELVFTK